MAFCASVFVVVALLVVPGARGHGMLLDPPARASLWRFGYDVPPDYNDNQLFCGGFDKQWNQNGGLCGVCGDAYDEPRPRTHEAGGPYAKGIIVRTYEAGSTIVAQVQLTANHKGWLQFKLCPNNDVTKEASQECLDQNVLSLADGTGTRFVIPEGAPSYVKFDIPLVLPAGLTCTQCVFQWHYNCGNSWGTCDDGTSAIGCGPQETFMACADIAIV